jgi:prevent-host-death family protein
MQKIIAGNDLELSFQTVIEEVDQQHTPYVLTLRSRPAVALIPYDEYLIFREMRKQEAWGRFDASRARLAEQNAAFSEEEIVDDLNKARREVRSARQPRANP